MLHRMLDIHDKSLGNVIKDIVVFSFDDEIKMVIMFHIDLISYYLQLM